MYPGQVAGARQLAGGGTGGDDQRVVGDVRITGPHSAGVEVQARGRCAQQHLCLEVLDELGAAVEDNRFGCVIGAEELLGQGRPIVRRMGFGSDQGDPALEAGLARRLDGAHAREGGPDHDQAADLLG